MRRPRLSWISLVWLVGACGTDQRTQIEPVSSTTSGAPEASGQEPARPDSLLITIENDLDLAIYVLTAARGCKALELGATRDVVQYPYDGRGGPLDGLVVSAFDPVDCEPDVSCDNWGYEEYILVPSFGERSFEVDLSSRAWGLDALWARISFFRDPSPYLSVGGSAGSAGSSGEHWSRAITLFEDLWCEQERCRKGRGGYDAFDTEFMCAFGFVTSEPVAVTWGEQGRMTILASSFAAEDEFSP